MDSRRTELQGSGKLGPNPDRKRERTKTHCVMKARGGTPEMLRQAPNDFNVQITPQVLETPTYESCPKPGGYESQ